MCLDVCVCVCALMCVFLYVHMCVLLFVRLYMCVRMYFLHTRLDLYFSLKSIACHLSLAEVIFIVGVCLFVCLLVCKIT